MTSFDTTRLTAARLWVVSSPTHSSPPGCDAPRGLAYLARGLYALIPVATPAVAQMSIDEQWRLYINPDWLADADIPVIGRELVHLLWHLLNQHAVRARAVGVTTQTREAWHFAADTAIRELCEDSASGPEDLPIWEGDPKLTVEARFAQLSTARPDDTDPAEDSPDADDDSHDHRDCGSGADGFVRDHEAQHLPDLPKVTKVESDALRREIAAAAGPSAGRVGRWVEDVSSGPQVPWQQVLAGAVRRAVSHTAGRGDYNYRRPSRRAAVSPRVVLPSPHRPVPGVAIVIDTSGSMSAAALAHVLAEFDTILDALQLGEHGVIGIAVDTAATATPARRAADVLLVGGGGTDMTLGISVAEELRPKPELCVVFTDGYTPWPDEPVGGMTVVAALVADGRDYLPPTPEWMVRVECDDVAATVR
ncbi:MAG TPA: VWA-like domain-containing protein [Gordonia sp. (in: high G+C Gram-positive bacteria)]|uniref:vWA domain-containing protein n=1 Tax=unclassified Gordonia (in: high G+C Gram-positive bacteria) TaxID=2657482 RepID=UPI0025BE6EF4|nr:MULTISPECIES: VWA-like domain-containing protein [unclassified Gordonia (in: high G+C Gram-positive bacteria)]HNP58611.1 VWA-like domain-containing protein [Gordonia sp. (in: high G+C Gram-positive bacteria)]HRC49750.1 VWA-like domain-containing protein [Gordonia sp. (in: high G+C Gram-positive bacteria)]